LQKKQALPKLNSKDLSKLFSRFGNVGFVTIYEGLLNSNKALVGMPNLLEAYHAFKTLNQK
jgi:hypothetical protein